MEGDPVQKAARICYSVAALDAVLGVVLIFAGKGDEGLVRLSYGCLAESPVMFVLGWGISRESALCALVAALLQTGSAFLASNCATVIVQAAMAVALWKGCIEIRVRASMGDRAASIGSPVPIAPRPSARLGKAPAPQAPAPEPAPPAPAPAPGPKMVCPNCKDTFPMGTKTCAECKVALFRD